MTIGEGVTVIICTLGIMSHVNGCTEGDLKIETKFKSLTYRIGGEPMSVKVLDEIFYSSIEGCGDLEFKAYIDGQLLTRDSYPISSNLDSDPGNLLVNSTDFDLAGTTIQVYFDVKLVVNGRRNPELTDTGPLEFTFEKGDAPYYFINETDSSSATETEPE